MPDILDIPDAVLQQRYPGYDIAALKEAYRQAQAAKLQQTEKSGKPVTETIKTDPETGEQTVTISGSPEALSASNPYTPTVVSAAVSSPEPSARPMMRPRPVSPEEAYNQYTARMESGGNPNVGYHNPQKSSAYGTYGITQPQYQEIQRANPQFAGRDISSLSPEEQGQANTTSRDVYAQQLRAKGVEPTEENLRLAHFLGAGGANQYLKSGAISPQAAAANGGEERVRQIAQQRLQGPAVPGQQPEAMIAGTASSDVELTPTEQAIARMSRTPGFNPLGEKPTVDQQASNALIAAGNNPTKLYALAGNENFPENFRSIARDMALQHDKFKDTEQRVIANITDATNGNVTAAQKMLKSLNKPGEEGSITKAVLLGLIGLKSMAKDEYLKYSGQYYKTDRVKLDNEEFTVQRNPSGAIVHAYYANAEKASPEKIAELNARAMSTDTNAFGFTGGSAVIPEGQPNAGQEYRQRTNSRTGVIENVITTGPDSGKIYTGAPGLDRSVGTAAAKMDYGVISKYREKYGTDILSALDQFRKDRGAVSPQEEQAFLNGYRFSQGPMGVGAVPGMGGQPTQAQPGQAQPMRPVAPAQAQPGQAQPPVAGPAVPSQVQPGQAQPPVAGPAVPGQPQTQPQVAGAPGAPSGTSLQNRAIIDQIGPMRPRGVNESESSYAAYKKVYDAQANDLATGQAKVQLNLPQYISTADSILKNIDQVTYETDRTGAVKLDKDGNPIISEGFKSNVGIPGITGIVNIPGTVARDWRAKYKSLDAKQFMLQFEKLRGAGAITDKEGETAKAALSALQDPGIREEEFLKNAEELRNIIKVGANRQLMLAGKEPDPRYFLGNPKQAKAAYDWAKANPNDPRTPEILEKIGLR
jgi:hypothetical protein